MSKDEESSEIGEVFQESYECETITWKISNVSILEITQDTEVQSPCFSYKKATWVLKIHPYPFKVYIERLHSEIPVHEFLCASFFKSHKHLSDSNSYRPLKFNLNSQQNFMYFDYYIYNWHSLFYHDSVYRYNDTVSLIVKILMKRNAAIGLDSETKSPETALGSINTTTNDASCKPFGELDVESFDGEVTTWKIPKIRSITLKVDKRLKSPPFYFAGASWILTMFPYGQTKFGSEGKIDLVIDRVCYLFPKHHVTYRIFFKAYNKEFDEKGYRLRDFGETIDRKNFFNFQANNTRENSFIFQANNERENICNVHSYSYLFSLVGPNQPSDTVFLVCDLRTKNNAVKRLDVLSKSHQLDTESLQKISREELVAPLGGFSFKESSQKASREEPVRLFGECSLKKSSQKTPREEPVAPFGGFSSKGSLQKTSKEEPVAQFKGSSQNTPKEEPAAPFSGFSFKGSSEEPQKQEKVPFVFSYKSHDNEPRESVELPSKKFLSDMKELFLKQEDCDVILKVKEQEFPAHRLILKARSPVFASTFKYDTKEKATGVIDIEDCDPSSFSDFLYFLYCGTSEKLSSKNVFSLFTAADKYDVQDLRSECMKFIKKNLSIDNFCDAIVLALKHSEKELIELTTDFFRKNLQKIILTVKWQSFLIENPIQGNELLIKALSLNKT